jgi:DNA-binding SARP family transcriptional activator/tetratricopeptide (TPR) repeat protein
VRYRILGSLTVQGTDGRPCSFERRHSRILAVLLLSPNQVVSRDYLIDAVWDETPPATAGRQLQNCVSQLRQLLPSPGSWKQAISAEAAGYRLRLEVGELDAQVFAAGVAEAQREQAAGQIDGAATKMRQALSLWQGPALTGLAGRAIEAGSARLNEQRLTTWEDCLELDLRQGRHHGIIGELMQLTAAHPLRERAAGLLMRALHGSGRQVESLHAYDRLRRRLAEDLGLDPGPELQHLYLSILRGTASAPATSSPAGSAGSAGSAGLVGSEGGIATGAASLGRGVGGGEPGGAARPLALRQLPAPVRHFVGRDFALGELDQLIGAAGQESVGISVIHGTGGIGKTALAVRWAHRAAPRFPGGQLFVNLRGFDPAQEPMTPAEAIRCFLDAFAVPADQIPVSFEAQASLYRTLAAERALLIVLDNARDVDQVRPLLPGNSRCVVIVTSRNELTGLVAVEGARPLTLGLLTTGEARRLLASHLGQARLDAEPAATAELVTRCAQLPLALAIIAARAAAHPTFPLATFSAELADTRRRLDAVDGGDEFSQVRSVFSWSYQRLSTRAAHLFRLLGLQRGADVTVPAAASLAGVPVDQARQLLGDLARAHLVTEHQRGRFTFHDLLSAYATELASNHDPENERRIAVRRLLTYDLHAAAAADVLVAPHRRRTPLPEQEPPVAPPRLRDHAEALAWLEAERINLVCAVRLACDYQEYSIGWRLASVLWGLFHLAKHWGDWIGTHETGLVCARECGDRGAEFTMLSSLGTAFRELRRFDDAVASHQAALTVSRERGDRHGEAQALNGLGAVYGDFQQAAMARRFLLESLAIRREVGDRWGEAITICNLGEQELEAGDLVQARDNFLAALEIRREIGDRWGEAVTLAGLGQADQAAGRPAEAAGHLLAALAIHREFHDLAMQAHDLHHLGLAHRALGEPDRAEECLREALALYQRLGMPAAGEVLSLLSNDPR